MAPTWSSTSAALLSLAALPLRPPNAAAAHVSGEVIRNKTTTANTTNLSPNRPMLAISLSLGMCGYLTEGISNHMEVEPTKSGEDCSEGSDRREKKEKEV